MAAPLPTTELSAAGLLAAFGRSDTTPSEQLDACLARLDMYEPTYHALRTRCDDTARAAAEVADRRWRRGEARALEGVPFAVKDNIATEGVLTTVGSRLYAGRVPDRNAAIVQRLLDAGAILVGKTATPEFAFGDAIEGHMAVNPWNPECWTGGSSSGSAVALAVGEVPIALGTDTGGSIRVPASYCGVAGFKPTFGVVPRDGVFTVSWTLDHAGPMARTVDDLALLLTTIAGPSATDPWASSRPLEGDGDRGVVVGVPDEWFAAWGTPEVLDAAARTVEALAGLGARTHAVSLPSVHLAGMTAWTITVAEFASLREDERDRVDEMTPSAAERFRRGAAMPAADYLRALHTRAAIARELETAMAEVDVLVTPATPTPAPRIDPNPDELFEGGDSAWLERIARNFLVANVTGAPALVVPVAAHDGLPIAVQLLARPFADLTCLRVGRALTAVSAGIRPAVFGGRDLDG